MPSDSGQSPIYENDENRLKILCMGFEKQVQYLRLMSNFDLRVCSGYITLQLAVGGWLATKPLKQLSLQVGMMIIDLTLGVLAIGLFHFNRKRRTHARYILGNLNEALGFTTEGVFIKGKAIQGEVPLRHFYRLYVGVVIVAVIAVGVVIFGFN